MNLKLLIGITFISISLILYIGGFLLLFISIISPFIILMYKARNSRSSKTIGFFHPYCNDGGGGERVLWCLIRCLQKKYGDKFDFAIFTGDNVTKEEILQKAKSRFNIEIDGKNIRFINLKTRNFVEANYYPYFTMLGQSLGSMIVGCEAIFKYNCFIMFDTMGYAFTYPIFKLLGGSKVFCYTHYPTISSDMLKRVVERRNLYNNNEKVTSSVTLSSVKINYYKLFAKIYGLFGSFSDLIFVNSTWTANHINEIWKCKQKTFTLFPPCDTTATQNFDFDPREDMIISISQFRPEKDQKLQIKAYSLYKRKWLQSSKKSNLAKFYLIGSCRNESDQKIISEAKQLCQELGVEKDVEFVINADYKKLLDFLSKAKIGLHSMWNEHFGIGVVELLSSGTVTIAHNSGGPKEDIVTKYEGKDTGYLASTDQEYSDFIFKIMENFDDHKLMRESARSSVKRFSEQEFERSFSELISKYL